MLGPILLYYYSVSSANSLFPLTSDKARKLGVTVKQAESDAWFKALEKKNSQHQTFTEFKRVGDFNDNENPLCICMIVVLS